MSLADKREVIEEVFGDRYPESFVRFLLVLLENRRQGLLPEIEVEARELLNERTGQVRASVTMTVDPDPELRAEIETALARVLGREVTADFRRDPRLVGGMIVTSEGPRHGRIGAATAAADASGAHRRCWIGHADRLIG